jgi:hypothetical protein
MNMDDATTITPTIPTKKTRISKYTEEERKERKKEAMRKCYHKHKEERLKKYNEYNRKKYHSDPVYRIKNILNYKITDEEINLCNQDYEKVKIYLKLKKMLQDDNNNDKDILKNIIEKINLYNNNDNQPII